MITWYCYIVRCADNSYYTGVAKNVSRRIRQHNGSLAGGAKYTRSRRPVVLVRAFGHKNRSDALRHEHRIKALDHEHKARYDESNYRKDQRYLGPPVIRSTLA